MVTPWSFPVLESIGPWLAPAASVTIADVTEAPSVGAVKVNVPVWPCSMTFGETVKLPVNDAGWTTDTETSGGCPVLPDCTETPDRLVTRSE